MVIFKIGEGRTPSGKILDRDTHFYTLSEKAHAIEDAVKTGKNIYVSRHNKKYIKLTLEELKEYK